MSRLKPYKAEVSNSGPSKIININPAEKVPQNWQIMYGNHGLLLFETKAGVKRYLKKKYQNVKILD